MSILAGTMVPSKEETQHHIHHHSHHTHTKTASTNTTPITIITSQSDGRTLQKCA